jgi:hypothetical protein
MIGFTLQAQVFKLRFISAILGKNNSDWVHLACAEIKASMRKGVTRKEVKF